VALGGGSVSDSRGQVHARERHALLVKLCPPPQRVFSGVEISHHAANYFRFRLGLTVEIALGAEVLAGGPVPAGVGESVELFACRERHGTIEPYDRLLSDAMNGDPPRRIEWVQPAEAGPIPSSSLVEHRVIPRSQKGTPRSDSVRWRR
jgi:hypothetical protein